MLSQYFINHQTNRQHLAKLQLFWYLNDLRIDLLIHVIKCIKGTTSRIRSQFLLLMEKSILYAKIIASQKRNLFQNSVLNIIKL